MTDRGKSYESFNPKSLVTNSTRSTKSCPKSKTKKEKLEVALELSHRLRSSALPPSLQLLVSLLPSRFAIPQILSMPPVSTKKEQERSRLYSSHGISASRFDAGEIRRHPALTLETLEQRRDSEKKKKKKESASVRQKNAQIVKNSGSARVSRISGELKPIPEGNV